MIIGDFMKNTIISLFFCLLLGLVMSFYLFKQYDVPVSKEAETLTFLQTAVYSDLDSLQKNININQYIYNEEKDGIHVYVAITKNNTEQLKSFFEQKGYSIYPKEVIVTNSEFIKEVENADLLLQQLTDEKSIMVLVREILEKYGEVS